MTRQRLGYFFTGAALVGLVLLYGGALVAYFNHDYFGTLLRAMMSLVPLLLLLPFVLARVPKAFQILALLAPWHFFMGGVIWLWGAKGWGLAVCLLAVLLQLGTILHNYQRRKKKPQ